MNAIELAIKMERDAIEFYKEAAEKTRHPFGKKMFQGFVEDERRHLKMLNDIFTGLDLKIDTLSPRKRVKSIFEELKSKMMQRIKADTDEIEAIKIAMDFEKKGYEFYKKTAEETKDKKEKSLFEALTHEEEEHFSILQNTLFFITDTGSWFMWEEHSAVDGGTPWA
jgi:rubrerythrin